MATTCQNTECPQKPTCRHNIFRDGMACAGNADGYKYRSRTVDLKRRIREGELPLQDYSYAELIHDLHH